ncbi:MAG: oligosaccharide flippase family protein [Cyclobacteriaceae bacterium]|nr:oligosaccharide flippase family protein [Cyclobacteriaceae bacterium]
MLPKVIGFLLIPVYTVYLSPQDFGLVDLATSLGAFILVFMRLGVPGSVLRFYFDHQEGEALKDYITTIFWFLLGCSLIVGAVTALILYTTGDKIVPGLPFYPFVVMILIWAFFNSNTDLQRRLLQAREQSAYSAKLSTITALLTISLTILFVIALKWGAVGVVGATVITAIVFFIQGQVYLHKDLKGKFSWSQLIPSFTYAMGILPYHLISNAAPVINKSILSGYESLAAVGILGIALRFTIPLTIFISALQSSFTPLYYSVRTDEQESLKGKKNLGDLVVRIWSVALLLLAGIICFGGLAIQLFTTEKFHEAIHLLPGISISFIIGLAAYIFGNEIYYQKKTWWVAIISTVQVGVNFVGLLLFLPLFGLIGVGYAMLVAAIVAAILQVLVARKYYQFSIPWKKFLLSIVLMLGLVFLSHLIDTRLILWRMIYFGFLFVIFVWAMFYFKLLQLQWIPLINKIAKKYHERR